MALGFASTVHYFALGNYELDSTIRGVEDVHRSESSEGHTVQPSIEQLKCELCNPYTELGLLGTSCVVFSAQKTPSSNQQPSRDYPDLGEVILVGSTEVIMKMSSVASIFCDR